MGKVRTTEKKKKKKHAREIYKRMKVMRYLIRKQGGEYGG